MRKYTTAVLFAFALLLSPCLLRDSDAADTFGDLRGTVQTTTTTGGQTFSLGATTTILRFNASSQVDLYGITGGADGRFLILVNSGSGHVNLHPESSSAGSASDRLYFDSNGAYRVLFGQVGIAFATYDGTTARWRLGLIEGHNSGANKQTNGDHTVTGSLTNNGYLTSTGFPASLANTTILGSTTPRLVLKSTHGTSDASTVRWQDNAASTLWSLGSDYNGNGGQDWWLFDNVNSITNLYLKNTGLSYLSMGDTYGGIQYDNTDMELGLFVDGGVKIRLNEYAWKFDTLPFYTRQTSGSSLPTKGSNCNGSGTATQHADSGDARGSVTLGTGATACTLSFYHPFDLEQSPANGFPICTANSSTSAVAITAIDDHSVTFTPSSSGVQTIYYHCDGIIDPP